jgi:hypothetical protein
VGAVLPLGLLPQLFWVLVLLLEHKFTPFYTH